MKMTCSMSSLALCGLNCIWLFATHQVPCPWNFLRKNTGVECHFLLQGNLSNPEIKPMVLAPTAWQVDSLPLAPPGKHVTPHPINIFPASFTKFQKINWDSFLSVSLALFFLAIDSSPGQEVYLSGSSLFIMVHLTHLLSFCSWPAKVLSHEQLFVTPWTVAHQLLCP